MNLRDSKKGALNDRGEVIADRLPVMLAQFLILPMISSVSGADFELTSFVSEKNTNVESVQFVIKTAAVAEDTAMDEIPVVEEKLNFWQKLLRLFGLY